MHNRCTTFHTKWIGVLIICSTFSADHLLILPISLISCIHIGTYSYKILLRSAIWTAYSFFQNFFSTITAFLHVFSLTFLSLGTLYTNLTEYSLSQMNKSIYSLNLFLQLSKYLQSSSLLLLAHNWTVVLEIYTNVYYTDFFVFCHFNSLIYIKFYEYSSSSTYMSS